MRCLLILLLLPSVALAQPPIIDKDTAPNRIRLAAKLRTITEIDPKILAAVVLQESQAKPNAWRFENFVFQHNGGDFFKASSIGIMQVMGWHAGVYPCEFLSSPMDLLNIENNVRCGTAILADAIKRNGSVEKGLIEYNAGWQCVQNNCRWGKSYARKILGLKVP